MMKRVLALLFAVLMMAGIFAGCSSNGGEISPTPGKTVTPTPSGNAGTGKPADPYETVDYSAPLVDTPVTYSAWWPYAAGSIPVLQSMSDNLAVQTWEGITGLKLSFVHPVANGQAESFNLMITSGDYCDMMCGFATYYTRGVDYGIQDDTIIALNDYVKYMPNHEGYRTASKEVELQSLTDSGNIWGIYRIENELQGSGSGIFVRQDLLDKYSLDMPVTIADWENTLGIIKDNENMKGPMWMSGRGRWGSFAFLSAFGSGNYYPEYGGPFICVDNKATMSVLTPGFREYIETMADWYSKGLIYRDFETEPVGTPDNPKVMNGDVFTWSSNYTAFNVYNTTAADPNFKVAPAPWPAKNKGDIIHYSGIGTMVSAGSSMAISAQCDNVPLLLRAWDYFFTDEGIILANYGQEGLTFEYNGEGKPEFTELMYNNPDGLTIGQTQRVYIMHVSPVYNIWSREFAGAPQEMLDAYAKWNDPQYIDNAYWMPTVTLTYDEGQEYAQIIGDIQTYMEECVIKFINNTMPINEYDAFLAQLNTMGIQRCVEIYQAALDRYVARAQYLN